MLLDFDGKMREDNHSPVLIAQDRANIIRVKSLPNFSKSWKWVDSKQNPLVLKQPKRVSIPYRVA